MIDPNKVHVARGIGLFCLYAFMFWRTFKDNPGNRVIQCGSITLMLFLVMVALMQIPRVPFDYVAYLGPALFLLCMLTMFFLFQQGYRALRKRFKDRSAPTDIKSDAKCTFCLKSRGDAGKLIESPDERTYICDQCALQPTHLALVSQKSRESQSSSRLGIFFGRVSCSFCKQKVRPSRAYVSAGCENSDSYICKSCLSVCRQFLSDDSRATNTVNSW
jgi:ClpX C4-type zinc finger